MLGPVISGPLVDTIGYYYMTFTFGKKPFCVLGMEC